MFNNKEFWYYFKCLIDITLSGIVFAYFQQTLVVTLNTIIIQILALILSPIIKKKLGSKKRKFLQIVMLLSQLTQIFYCCFYFEEVLHYGYLLIKFYEKQLVELFQNQFSYISLISLNALQLYLLIYWDEKGVAFFILGYATMLIFKDQHKKIKKKNKNVQQTDTPMTYVKTATRQSLLVNRISDSISLRWIQKLQTFPVGIMIVQKEKQEILFENDQLLQIFEGVTQIGHLVLESLECTIIKQKKNIWQTSIVLDRSLPLQPILSNKTFTVKQILNLYSLGLLNKYKTNKDDQIELSATFCKGTEAFVEERNLLLKITSAEDDNDFLIVIQDITLQNSLKKAETREQFIVKMIDSFSHELRTPLNSAELFLQALVQNKELPQKLKEQFIEPAKNSLRLQAYIIRDIIDFTQFNQNIIKYNYSEFHFLDLIQEINDLYKLIFQHKKIGLHINAQKSIPDFINSDFNRIMQILVNILSNSVKFSSGGQVEVKVQGYDGYVLFNIHDQGIGIENKQLQKIQQQLEDFALNRTISLQEEWQGLGLIVSQMILISLAPQNKPYLQITSKGLNYGVEVKFRIKTQTQSSTQQFSNFPTIKRGSLLTPRTVPNLGEGITGLLIISNAGRENSSFQNIPAKEHSSVAEYYKQSIISPQQQFDTDLQIQDSDRSGISNKLINLKNSQTPRFLRNSHSSNSLISRFHQRSDDQSQIQSHFTKLKFKCGCRRALSVDDDSFNQKALQIILGQMGFEIQLAYNGQQAIDIIKNTKKCCSTCNLFIFILMDCQMPILDGWQTTKRIRGMINSRIIPNIPVIGLTAFNGQNDIEKCLESGMQNVLTKPLNISDFQQALINLYKFVQ